MHMFPHYPVLLSEVVEAFDSISPRFVIDGTLGAGGHAEALLKTYPTIEQYIGIDQDPSALLIAQERLKPWIHKTLFKHGNFAELKDILKEIKVTPDAILVDLGVSSMQLDQPLRGFSFMREGPLDMRMNPHLSLTAADILNTWPEEKLAQIFRDYGEEKQWRKAASIVIEKRKNKLFLTTLDLNQALASPLAKYAKKGIHPLTLIFQALRICVNQELDVLESFLTQALDCLAPKGRLAVISFHSLEDRIVKTRVRHAASDKLETSGLSGLFLDKDPTVKLITRKPIEATEEEIKLNPRSRSAKLRVIEKL